MGLRDAMNNNSALVTLIAIVVLVISLGVVVMQLGGKSGHRTVDLYFYDLNTGELFEAKSDQIPPIEAPSGPLSNGQPAGVKAFVFSCTDCSDEKSVGWLETYTEEAKAALTAEPGGGMEMDYYEVVEQGQLIKPVEGGKWVPMNSEAGYKLTEKLQNELCPGGELKACYPGR